MSGASKNPFLVDYVPQVSQQIKDLGALAKQAKLFPDFLKAMMQMLARLRRDPVAWGDPLYDTKKPGGKVFRGIIAPLQVRYAVFHEDRVVFILDVKPSSHSGLE